MAVDYDVAVISHLVLCCALLSERESPVAGRLFRSGSTEKLP